MSIRLRLTLLYTLILALTLLLFGTALYTVQAQGTLNALKQELSRGGESTVQMVLRFYRDASLLPPDPPPGEDHRPPLQDLSSEPAFQQLREREIVRVLNAEGVLVATPFAAASEALPLSVEGLDALRNQEIWWEIASWDEARLLIYNRPVIVDDELVFIVQTARPLTEREDSLRTLSRTLLIAGVLTTVIAFGIGWALAGAALRPIHRITQTAQAIGNESDFSRRVDYTGPDDEVGRLATTFNAMLVRLEEAYRRVSEALSLQRDFVADVSHELRTPLTTIRGNLALLRRTPPLPEAEQNEILVDAEVESDRMTRLVNNLLLLARADAGPSLKHAPVAVAPVIEESCRQARQLDRQREIVEHIAKDVTVLGDRDALKQIALILLDNALKHSQGSITVSVKAEAPWALLEVRDVGPGIAPDLLPHVFDRFHRGQANSDTPGFGLGLPIAKTLVEGCNGAIAIESTPGCGSVVRVRLPLWAEQDAKPGTSATER
ncbi:MAG: Signal transduction histidine-protein kinase BaeS [Chloroflexi bacterium ADurb.Bin360]|nr:MAG: Signal transduction histidine-protein kinase BaeS [Chloroflexi bacterium ADurb.Bin360]